MVNRVESWISHACNLNICCMKRHIRKQVKHLTYSFLRMCKLKDASHYFRVKSQRTCLTGLWIHLWYKLATSIRNYSGPHFSAFGLNAATREFRIQSKCGKIWTKTIPNTNIVYVVLNISGTLKNETYWFFQPKIGQNILWILLKEWMHRRTTFQILRC